MLTPFSWRSWDRVRANRRCMLSLLWPGPQAAADFNISYYYTLFNTLCKGLDAEKFQACPAGRPPGRACHPSPVRSWARERNRRFRGSLPRGSSLQKICCILSASTPLLLKGPKAPKSLIFNPLTDGGSPRIIRIVTTLLLFCFLFIAYQKGATLWKNIRYRLSRAHELGGRNPLYAGGFPPPPCPRGHGPQGRPPTAASPAGRGASGADGLSVAGPWWSPPAPCAMQVSTDGTAPLAYVRGHDTIQAAVQHVETQVSEILRSVTATPGDHNRPDHRPQAAG